MEPKISVEESVNHSLHLKKSEPDTQRAKMYTRHYREPTKKIIPLIYDENLPSDPLLSEPDIGMLSSPSQGQNVGGMEVPTTPDFDHEDLGKPTHQHGQDDIDEAFEGRKKDGVEENNLAAQQGNQVRYINRRGELKQSEECPEHGLGCKDQDEASASLSESAIQNEEAGTVCKSVNTAVQAVNNMTQNMDEYEICESEKDSNVPEKVSKPYDEKKDSCLSEPYQDKATKPPGDNTIPVYGRSTADIKEKNNPKARHAMSDQYVGAENLVAGGPTEYEGCMTFPTLGQMGKPESQLPNNKMKNLCDESIGGTSQQEGLEMESEENSTSGVPFGGPNRRFGKDTFQSINHHLIEESEEATGVPKVTNNKEDEMAGKPKKRQKPHGKTKSGFQSPSCVMLVVYLFSMFSVVQASDGKWHLSWFCEGKGLNGTNPSITIDKDKFCTSSNVTIKNMQYEGFLLLDTCAVLLTQDTTVTPYLERVNHNQTLLTSKAGNFSTRDEAIKHMCLVVNPTPNVGTPVDIKDGQDTKVSDRKWHLSWFCEGKGLNGTNPSITIGPQKFCELSPPSNSCNGTIKNMQYEGFLLLDTCAALLTQATTITPYLERVNHNQTLLTSKGNFSTRDEAIKHMCLVVTPTPNVGTPVDIKDGQDTKETFPTREEAIKHLAAEVTPNNETSENAEERQDANYWIVILLILLVLSGVIVLGIYSYWLVKKRQSPKDTGSLEEAIELNVPPNTDEPQNISNGRSTENGHHHPSPSP